MQEAIKIRGGKVKEIDGIYKDYIYELMSDIRTHMNTLEAELGLHNKEDLERYITVIVKYMGMFNNRMNAMCRRRMESEMGTISEADEEIE
jgi:hypothetical protein